MTNELKMRLKEALDNFWLRVKGQVSPLETRVTDIEQAGYITQETDPTVPSWAKESTKPTYTALEVGALPDTTPIPSKTSDLTNDSGFITQETDPTVPSWAKESSKPTYTAAEVGAIPTTDKGAASGVAELDSGGKVPSSQLPSYVDDVLEYASLSAFPATGETGKIYIALDTNVTYRWSGSTYVEIASSLALGETSSTAYRGDRGKVAYDHAMAHGSAYSSGLYKITTNAEGHVTAVEAPQKSDITDLGIPGQDTTYDPITNQEIDDIIDGEQEGVLSMTRYNATAGARNVPQGAVSSSWNAESQTYQSAASEVTA